jgi:hypothetical protein
MEMNEQNQLEFVEGYLKAILFTEREDTPPGEFMPGAELDEICQMFERSAFVTAVASAALFMDEAKEMIPEDRVMEAGIDFHLTRCGSGAGFFDGDWPEHGDELTAICDRFGQVYYYEFEDLLHS